MGVTRRQMLGRVAGAATLTGVVAVVGVGNCSEEDAPLTYDRVMATVLAHFDFLTVPDDTVRAFLDAHVSHGRGWPTSSRSWSAFVSRFLLSTDFFPHGQDESRALAFVAYYDPYLTPCYNPLVSRG